MATNRDLVEAVRAGNFRHDLFNRIAGHVIEVPRLLDYIENLPAIATSIIARHCPEALVRERGGQLPTLSEADIDWAMNQEWEGNIRELEDVLEFWLFGGALGSLEHAAAGGRHRWGKHPLTRQPAVTTLVAARIQEIIEEQRPAPGTFGNFMKELTTEVREAVVEYYTQDPARARALFPDMTPASLKSSMSRARRR
jgi:DNA-binding NtrC family response regulator